jgi:hypothetical protein
MSLIKRTPPPQRANSVPQSLGTSDTDQIRIIVKYEEQSQCEYCLSF